jgi:hypothetical protein
VVWALIFPLSYSAKFAPILGIAVPIVARLKLWQ